VVRRLKIKEWERGERGKGGRESVLEGEKGVMNVEC